MFTTIPLEGRISKGVEIVKQTVVRQRKILAEQFEDRPPETRVTIDNFRAVKLRFTEPVDFPKNITQTIKK